MIDVSWKAQPSVDGAHKKRVLMSLVKRFRYPPVFQSQQYNTDPNTKLNSISYMLLLSPTSVTKDNLKGKVQRKANRSPHQEEEWKSANIRLTNGKKHKGVSAFCPFYHIQDASSDWKRGQGLKTVLLQLPPKWAFTMNCFLPLPNPLKGWPAGDLSLMFTINCFRDCLTTALLKATLWYT